MVESRVPSVSGRESLAAASPAQALGHRRLAIDVRPLVLAGLGLATVMATDLIDFGADHLRVQLLDASSDASWSHRVVSALLVGVTAVSVIGLWRSRAHRAVWAATAAMLGLLAIDEVSSLHAHIDQMTWGKALYAPILVVLGVCVLRLANGADQRVVLVAGLAALVVSFALHVFGLHVVHALGWGTNSWAYQVKVGLKEGTELAGALLVLVALWRVAVARGPSA